MNKQIKYNMINRVKMRVLYNLPTNYIYAIEPHTHIVLTEAHKM